MSPQLRRVSEVGMQAVVVKKNPVDIGLNDFFDSVEAVKKAFANIIHSNEQERIAIIPSVSYGMATVAKNVKLQKGQHILIAEDQFPSNYYIWKRLADKSGAAIRIVRPSKGANRAANWNRNILEAITSETALIALSHTHWADGTRFELEQIRQESQKYGTLLVIDGTQSVGTLPFDVNSIQPDALICAGYKGLLGPYGVGMAYYGKRFDGGVPIEENWINRLHSEDFKNLINYQSEYKPGANRYSVGEQSNFILLPMMLAALEQVLEWGVENIQTYCKELAKPVLPELLELGCRIEEEEWRCGQLFGIRLPEHIDAEKLKATFEREKVYVSIRGDSIRISPHLYSEAKDFELLLRCFQEASRHHLLHKVN